jgi:hypothetical protein
VAQQINLKAQKIMGRDIKAKILMLAQGLDIKADIKEISKIRSRQRKKV